LLAYDAVLPPKHNLSIDKNILDFTFLIAGTSKGQLALIQRGGHVFERMHVHEAAVVLLYPSPTDHLLISAGEDKMVHIFALQPEENEFLTPRRVLNVGFVPTCMATLATYLCLGSADGAVSVYSMRTGRHLIGHGRTEEHSHVVTSCVAFPLLEIFVTASLDGSLRVWNTGCVLIREVCFDEPITSMTSVSDRGDILIGIENRIDIIPHHKCMYISK